MSAPIWKDRLSAELARLRQPNRPVRLAVLGVGQELRGDDAVGVKIARSLMASGKGIDSLLALDAGTIPESATGPLRSFEPELTLLIDAADMGAPPGEIRWIDPRIAVGFSASTHSLPLSVLAGYIAAEFRCKVAILGIQPERAEILAELSEPVRQAAAEIEQYLLKIALQNPH